MHKYKIVLEYDGTNYRGWQTQKNAKSIQETLITAAQKFLGVPVQLQGAGRTDAGVHALAQTAHLESSKKVTPETLCIGINDNLPASINVLISLATTLSLYLGSGRIILLGTSLLLGIYFPSAKQAQNYFGRLAPYLERLCKRPLTPTESSVPRTM